MATKLREPYRTVYQEGIDWILTARKAGKSWGHILLCGQGDPMKAREFLARHIEEDCWQADMTYARWKALVHRLSKEEREREANAV